MNKKYYVTFDIISKEKEVAGFHKIKIDAVSAKDAYLKALDTASELSDKDLSYMPLAVSEDDKVSQGMSFLF